MNKLNFFKVAALPVKLIANAFYLVVSKLDANYVETYITDKDGNAKMIGNTTMINELIATALASVNQVQFAPDYKTMVATAYPSNVTVFVQDASADDSVAKGSAYYFFNADTGVFSKISEFESLDLVVDWSKIVGAPKSTPEQIDDLVATAHTHENKKQLDKIGEDEDGCLTFGGEPVMAWTEAAW